MDREVQTAKASLEETNGTCAQGLQARAILLTDVPCLALRRRVLAPTIRRDTLHEKQRVVMGWTAMRSMCQQNLCTPHSAAEPSLQVAVGTRSGPP